MKNKILFLMLALSVFAWSCNNNAGKKTANSKTTNSNSEFPYTQDAKPVADPEIAVIKTELGTFKMELYSNIAPKMVARFKELANEGVYNGTTFHRVNPSLGIIQGGDPLSKDNNPDNDGTGNSDKPNVPAEFSDIPYDKGIVGAARKQEPDSANSQFFIMTKRQPAFDKRYTIFGKIIEDPTNAVNTIAGAPTVQGTERPDPPVKIISVTIEKK